MKIVEHVMQAETALLEPHARRVIPIVPYSVKGKYRNIKTAILVLAYAVYFSLPWLTWHGDDRTGQALLFDIANSRFYFFDVVIYPQDLMIFMSVMVLAAVLLFIAATLYGRIFCGFFCFQTIWTDAFRLIETAIQGEAQARIRLRKQPWDIAKIYKIGATHLLWLLLSLVTAVTFTLYFAEASALITQIMRGDAAIAAYTAIATITATTYVAAGFAREDVCRVACPYGKFQSVMQDPGTKTVVYDTERGERALGRAAPAKDLKDARLREATGYGDCIDCGYCVNVCPTGVDIRKGFQIDCISCGLCIDACDNIMTSINLPTGLINFRPALQMSEKTDTGWMQANRLKRYGYLALLAICFGFLVFKLGHIEPFTATIQQQAQPLATKLSNGDLKSRYIIRLTNKSAQKVQYTVTGKGLPFNLESESFEVPAGKTYTYTFNLVLSAETAKQLRTLTFIISPQNNLDSAKEYRLGYVSSTV
jgi:cytochrome c oxidase accessory protein FixG